MKIEVGKKYQDRAVHGWTIVVIARRADGEVLVRYPGGFSQNLPADVIRDFYEPFEETPC